MTGVEKRGNFSNVAALLLPQSVLILTINALWVKSGNRGNLKS